MKIKNIVNAHLKQKFFYINLTNKFLLCVFENKNPQRMNINLQKEERIHMRQISGVLYTFSRIEI